MIDSPIVLIDWLVLIDEFDWQLFCLGLKRALRAASRIFAFDVESMVTADYAIQMKLDE